MATKAKPGEIVEVDGKRYIIVETNDMRNGRFDVVFETAIDIEYDTERHPFGERHQVATTTFIIVRPR